MWIYQISFSRELFPMDNSNAKLWQFLCHSSSLVMHLKCNNNWNLCICPRANTVYIPEWLTGWPLWCPPPPPFWMIENHFRMHFSPFQINTQLFIFFLNGRRLFHYVLSMPMPNMKLIDEFMTQLETPQAFWAFLYKMAARGHFTSMAMANMNLIGVFSTFGDIIIKLLLHSIYFNDQWRSRTCWTTWWCTSFLLATRRSLLSRRPEQPLW